MLVVLSKIIIILVNSFGAVLMVLPKENTVFHVAEKENGGNESIK